MARMRRVGRGAPTEAWSVSLDAERHPFGDGEVRSSDRWRALADSLNFSDRELEVVQCPFDDRTDREAADDLSVSVNPVHTHLSGVYRELGVSTRCGFAARVLAAYRANESETTNEH